MNQTNQLIKAALETGCLLALRQIDLISYIYITYKQWYYIGKPIIDDHEFDDFENKIRAHWPDNPVLDVVGIVYPACSCCRKKRKDPDYEFA